MNKKGFAISVIMYSIVFLLVTIFYITLGILKARYNVNDSLKKAVMEELNTDDNIFDTVR